MSRRKKTPIQKLAELVDEAGVLWVKEAIEIWLVLAKGPNQSPSPRPKMQPRASQASKKAIPEEVKP